MAAKLRGWYVVTHRVSGTTKVHGGPYNSQRAAREAIYAGLKVKSSDVELEYFSASDVQRRQSILIMPTSTCKRQPAQEGDGSRE